MGGVFTAGPQRLDAAATAGIPQVISLGAAEIGTFGPPDTVPARYRERLLYRHNDSITLMRISADEAARLGRYIAAKLDRSTGPVTVFVPRGGLSSLSVPGAVFHDPVADAAMFAALREALDPRIAVVEMDASLNDPAFALAMATRLDELMRAEAQR